jgi:hypothetical protein
MPEGLDQSLGLPGLRPGTSGSDWYLCNHLYQFPLQPGAKEYRSRVKHYPVHTYPGEPHEQVAPQKVSPPPATASSCSSESSPPSSPSGEALGSTR